MSEKWARGHMRVHLSLCPKAELTVPEMLQTHA